MTADFVLLCVRQSVNPLSVLSVRIVVMGELFPQQVGWKIVCFQF